LQSFEYRDFSKLLKEQWLKNGRQQWYITGNLSPEEAKDMVTEARDQLNLNPIPKEEIGDTKIIKLEPGVSWLL